MNISLQEKITTRQAKIGVIGLGYVGLPLLMSFSEENFHVIGFDIDKEKIDYLQQGKSYIKHIDSEKIIALLDRKNFQCTTDFSRLVEVNVIIICVPTPLGEHQEPDLQYVENTTHVVKQYLQRGQLVVLESTTYPGTTEEVLKPIFEMTGLKEGKDFYLAFSPEREDPGNPVYNTRKIPKVVGSDTKEGQSLVDCLYSTIVPKTVVVSNSKTAEAVKITENIFRCVNIALVNELKTIYSKMGINIWEVIDAASTKPFGFMPFYPGPGLGGHCIPIDPFYLTWKAKENEQNTRFIELAGEINTQMPQYVIDNLMRALNEQKKALNGSSILILGMAYKKDVDDIRESPALHIFRLLLKNKAIVDYYDPYISQIPKTREYSELQGIHSIEWTTEKIASYDACIIVTDHSNINYEELVEYSSLIIDTRNATKKITHQREKIVLS